MIAYVKTIFNKIKTYISNIILFLFILMIPIIIGLYKKVKKYDLEIGSLNNNLSQYQSLVDNSKNDNRVLQLTIEDFKYSRDSLIKVIDKQKKELKIKDNELKNVSSVETVIRDTTIVTVPIKEKNFEVELKPNDLTSIIVSKKDSILTTILDIKNEQIIYVSEKKEYRNRYKNFFQRMFHFDFKKDKIQRYNIFNTNDLIQITNTRIINIKD